MFASSRTAVESLLVAGLMFWCAAPLCAQPPEDPKELQRAITALEKEVFKARAEDEVLKQEEKLLGDASTGKRKETNSAALLGPGDPILGKIGGQLMTTRRASTSCLG